MSNSVKPFPAPQKFYDTLVIKLVICDITPLIFILISLLRKICFLLSTGYVSTMHISQVVKNGRSKVYKLLPEGFFYNEITVSVQYLGSFPVTLNTPNERARFIAQQLDHINVST